MNAQFEKYMIEETKDRHKILKIEKDNRWVYIGSKYNMQREIDKFINKFDNIIEESVLMVFGFAIGEHIKALRKKYPKNIIIIYEPNNDLKEFIKQNKWIDNDNLMFVVYNNSELRSVLESCITEVNFNVVDIQSFANYDKIYIKENAEFLKETKDGMMSALSEKSTRLKYSKTWFETLMGTLPYSLDGVPADEFTNKFKNKPAVIVSAGPSLSKNIKELKKVNDKVFIISSGRTLRPLIENGIKPHLLVVLDPVDVAYIQCKDYLDDIKGVPLLYYEGTNVKVVENHSGMKLFYGYNKIFEVMLGRKMKIMESAGSVAHTMTSYAIMLGCSPIIFIGQDFAYTGDKFHAEIADNKYGGLKFNDIKDSSDFYVEDVDGGKVRTSLVLNGYRRGLEIIISNHLDGIEYINATEGGAKIKHTIQMTLREALDKYKADSIPTFEEILKNLTIDNDKMKKNVIDYILKARKVANEIIKNCEEGNRYLKQYKDNLRYRDDERIYPILKRLDKIDKFIKKKFVSVELISSLIYPALIKAIDDGKIKKSEEERIKDNIDFYQSIIDELIYSLRYFNKFLQNEYDDKEIE